ncbi:MAG TPA: hypothetical protein VE967_14285 [Gemmatimonadaceae bacterium]|nr:hypothetical protein [Gemmatimonadaceae bacterium]
MTSGLMALVASCVVAPMVGAQRGTVPEVEVRLFPLTFLSNTDAATLVSPFVNVEGCYGSFAIGSPGTASVTKSVCGVYEAGAAVRGITVKAPRDILRFVDSLLKANDRGPTTLVFHFQLIAAVDSAGRDPGIPNDIDATLRDLFRFNGYRLLGQATATVESGAFSVTLGGGNLPYTIRGTLWGAARGEGRGSANGRGEGRGSAPARGEAAPPLSGSGVRMEVLMSGPMEQSAGGTIPMTQYNTLLSTGLTLPLGQTVVLGSGAGTGARRAVILTVRAEVLAKPK